MTESKHAKSEIERADSLWRCLIGDRLVEARPTLSQREGDAWPILQVSSETGASFYYLTGGSDARLLLKEMHERAEAESATLRAERDELIGVLRRNGFQECDIMECNCRSWHQVTGWPQRFAEFADALEAAGHPLTNENGNSARIALRALVAERDELRAACAWVAVSERMPDANALVLVTVAVCDARVVMAAHDPAAGFWRACDGARLVGRVTHWMPPPKVADAWADPMPAPAALSPREGSVKPLHNSTPTE